MLLSRRLTKSGSKDLINIVGFLVAFVGLWQLVVMLGIWSEFLLPPPLSVAQAFIDLIFDSSLFTQILISLWRLILGFSISIVIGMIIGLIMIKFDSIGRTVNSFAVGLQSFPSIAWIPFAILLIGLNDSGILFVVIMSSVFSVIMSTYSGIKNIPPIYLRAAKNMGSKGLSLFIHVMLPAATPSLMTGIKQAWSFAWHALIGAEMLITTLVGLGHILFVGREFSNMSQIIATMIIIFLLGLVFDRLLFLKLEEKIRSRWGLNEHNDN